MGIVELLILAVGLSMDAFAVAICKGLAIGKINVKDCAIVGGWFGAFQSLMPLIGWALASTFADKIVKLDHWIAFILLALIGAGMIKEAFSKEDDVKANASLNAKTMLLLAVATSIDALAAGVSLAFLEVNIVAAVLFIGAITFLLSSVGVKVGSVFGEKYKSRSELVGGVILILLGTKILLEHLGVLSF